VDPTSRAWGCWVGYCRTMYVEGSQYIVTVYVEGSQYIVTVYEVWLWLGPVSVTPVLSADIRAVNQQVHRHTVSQLNANNRRTHCFSRLVLRYEHIRVSQGCCFVCCFNKWTSCGKARVLFQQVDVLWQSSCVVATLWQSSCIVATSGCLVAKLVYCFNKWMS
jgi:hypothetical protein